MKVEGMFRNLLEGSRAVCIVMEIMVWLRHFNVHVSKLLSNGVSKRTVRKGCAI